jgi:quinol monooxygenase YgiN
VAPSARAGQTSRENAVLVVTRFVVEPGGEAAFRADAAAALRALAERPGWREGRLARATDDAGRWLLLTEWESVGAYRRALSGYDVKLHATPLLARAVPEPSAYEVLDPDGTSDRAADADTAGPGRSAP